MLGWDGDISSLVALMSLSKYSGATKHGIRARLGMQPGEPNFYVRSSLLLTLTKPDQTSTQTQSSPDTDFF